MKIRMAGKSRRSVLFMLTLVLTLSGLWSMNGFAAQEPAFQLNMDSLNLQTGVSSDIILSIINAQESEIISVEGLENFTLVSQSQSSYTSIVNNVTTVQVDVYLTVMPLAEGQFTLKANIKHNNQMYETNSLVVTVKEQPDSGDEISNLYVNTVISHEDGEAYLGEKIVVTYELYTRYNLDGYGFTDNLSIDGAVVKTIPDAQMTSEQLYLNGNRYMKYEVAKLVIDPIKTGALEIPSFNLQVNVMTDSGLFRSSTPQYFYTEPMQIQVKPLPTEGRPDHFSGIVGDLHVNGSYSRTQLDIGDSLVLAAEVYGNCNVDGIKSILSGGTWAGFTTYETQKDTLESVIDNQYHVQKGFDLILIPDQVGLIEVAPILISYFNPVTEKYEQAEIPGATIEVTGEMPPANLGNNGGIVGNVEQVTIHQVSYADTNDDYFSLSLKKEWLLWGLGGFAAAALLTGFLLWSLHRRSQDKTLKAMYRQILRAKGKQEVYNRFNDMMKHSYRINIKASAQSVIQSSLPDAELAAQVTQMMNLAETASGSDENDCAQMKDTSKKIYKRMRAARRGVNKKHSK